jgi:hypothetical protein
MNTPRCLRTAAKVQRLCADLQNTSTGWVEPAGATNVRISCDRADRFQQFCWNSRSAAIDRRVCPGTRRAAIDEDFGGLDVRSIVGR